jgi:hypothetical protein
MVFGKECIKIVIYHKTNIINLFGILGTLGTLGTLCGEKLD